MDHKTLMDIVSCEAFAYLIKALSFAPVLLYGRKHGFKEALKLRCNLGRTAEYASNRLLLPFPLDIFYIAYDHLKIDYLLKRKGIEGRIGDPVVDEMLLKQSKRFY